MKVVILPENITPFIPLLSKLLPQHPHVPILSNLILKAEKGIFLIGATDLELGGEIKVPSKIEKEGVITIPGKEFLELVLTFPKDKITLESEDGKIKVNCRNTKIILNGVVADDYPEFYKDKGELYCEFTKNEFSDIFSYLLFSVSHEETRPQLTGVYMDTFDEGGRFVTTDGYRLSVKSITGKKEFQKGVLVGIRAIQEIIQLKEEGDIKMFINKSESQVIFEKKGVVIVGRMIEGQFPDYRKVLPKEAKTTVVVDREETLQAVKLVSVLARGNSNIAQLEVLEDKIKLSSLAQGIGEGETSVECRKEGEGIKIAFNIKYLLDFLKAVEEKEVVMRLNSPVEPALFEVKDKNYLHVIMPIQMD